MKSGRKLALTAAAAVLLLGIGIGISYAWFAQHAAMSTLMSILPPDSISIIPINNETGSAITMLDLDFKEKFDSKDEDGTIHIRRPVCIKSTSPVHQLEVAHTTNLNQLSFAIYPTKKSGDGVIIPDESVQPIGGEYKNKDSGLAKAENLNNYKQGDSVEAHAYPLYWLAENSGDSRYVADSDLSKITTPVTSESQIEYDPAKQVDRTYYSTYYYLEISWQEDSKETDLFYIMAQNIAVTAKEGSVNGP